MLNKNIKRYFLSREEREKIKELINRDISYRQIASIIGRAKNTIIKEVIKGGGRKNYNPGHLTKSDTINTSDLECRISNLEMQLEILIDYLQEKNAEH